MVKKSTYYYFTLKINKINMSHFDQGIMSMVLYSNQSHLNWDDNIINIIPRPVRVIEVFQGASLPELSHSVVQQWSSYLAQYAM